MILEWWRCQVWCGHLPGCSGGQTLWSSLIIGNKHFQMYGRFFPVFFPQWQVQTSEDFSARLSLCGSRDIYWLSTLFFPTAAPLLALHPYQINTLLSAGLKQMSISMTICCWWVFFPLHLFRQEKLEDFDLFFATCNSNYFQTNKFLWTVEKRSLD